MEKEGKSPKGSRDTDLLLQWGNRKRLRCVKLKKPQKSTTTTTTTTHSLPNKKIASRPDKQFPSPQQQQQQQPSSLNKNSDLPMNSQRSLVASPEKEDRYYTTRGSLGFDDNGKVFMDTVKEDKGLVWPRLYITLSSKEKEEDFMAMKGCKPPQRPKKRAKLIQRSLLLVSPGAWLSDLCQERYEVREKKTSKKRPRGLKAMGSMESDSD